MAASTLLILVGLAATASADTSFYGKILGRGYNIGRSDLWLMSNVYSTQLFVDSMPSTCFHDTSCAHESMTATSNFDSTSSWSSHIKQDTSISGSGSYQGVSLTVSSSFGSSSDQSTDSDKTSVFMETFSRRACYQMNSECIGNTTYVIPGVFDVASSLPTNRSDDNSMQQWVNGFLTRYGSHITVASTHGASVKVLSSSSSQTQQSNECLQQKACGSVGYLTAKLQTCQTKSQCTTQKNVDTSQHTSCVLVGGDVSTVAGANDICSAGTSSVALTEFLNSGDMQSGSSAIRFQFKPIADLFVYAGMWEQADALRKATEYQTCDTKRFVWAQSSSGEYSCKCNIACANGGELDEDTCTCNCQGDSLHGFRGETCGEEYGMCQPGQGSGNSNAAKKCRKGNICGSWYNQYPCSSSQNCCITNFGGTCCDYGQTCHCGKTNCGCMSMSEALNASAPAEDMLII